MPKILEIFFYKILFRKGIFRIAVFLLTALLVFSSHQCCFAQGPEIQWQKTFGGSSSDEAESIIQTSDGGYIMAGWTFSNDADAGGNHGPGDGDCWIIKMDPTGNLQWKKMIGGTKYDDALVIRQTQEGGYIIAGHSSSRDGDIPGNYEEYLYDGIVIKLDPAGNIEWVRNLGGNGYDTIISIEQTEDGGYIFAGYTSSNNMDVAGNHGDHDAWIGKLDNAGNLQWQRCVGGKDRDVAWSITFSPDGGYVFTGHSNSKDGDINFNHGQRDILVGKLDASGNVEWIKTFGGSGEEWSNSIVAASDGGYVIAGHSFSNNGNVTTNYGLNDFWIIKIDLQGNLQWQKSYGGSNFEDPYQIDQTIDGGYVVAGRTLSVNGDVSSNNGDNDYWILKLDVNGNLQWEKSFGGSQQDVAHSIQETLDGGFIVAGTSYSSDGDVVTNLGKSDAWIIKLGTCTLNIPEVFGGITGSSSPCAGTPTVFEIETANDATGYTWRMPAGWTIISGQGTNSITAIPGNVAGHVSVIAYNSCKSSAEKKFSVTPINPEVLQITIKSDVGNNICQGSPVVFTADVSGATNPNYQWKKNGINIGTNANVYSDITLKNGDIISCELTGINKCGTVAVAVSPTIRMFVSPIVNPTIKISSSTVAICKGSEVQFTAAVSGQGSNPAYRWYVNNSATGSGLSTFKTTSLSNGDLVTAQIISSEVCAVSPTAESNAIAISVDTRNEAFAYITSTATTICKNDPTTFKAEVENAGSSPKYSWTVNGVAAGTNASEFTTRNLSDKDAVACMVTPGVNTCATNAAMSNAIKITINPLPQLTIYPTDTLVQSGSQVQFNTHLSEDVRSFNWSPSGMLLVSSTLDAKTVPIVSPTMYRLSIVTKDGCSMNKDVTVKPLNPLYIPNAFTPNKNGKNDLFRIPPGSDFNLTDFSIYDRWGERIFETTDINSGWDGRIKGVDQSSGVYVYKITGIQNGKPVFLKGTFTLVR